jgi:hypothetical protein
MKMTVPDWRQRAQDCMAAALATSNPQAQLQWLILYDSWRKFADLRERGQFIFIERPASGSVTAATSRMDSAAVESGNKLRARLMLGTDNDARQGPV